MGEMKINHTLCQIMSLYMPTVVTTKSVSDIYFVYNC